VGTLGQGDFFGELALLDAPVRTASVKAVEAVELYTLGKEDFREAVAESPSFEEQVRRVYQSIKIS
jgi:CRP-like cAMP-binding protein